jgi:small nuclear ribonucleoprotein (snRNP)-like protein
MCIAGELASADNQAPVVLDDVFYIGAASSASFNVLEKDADYECTDHGR